MENGREEVIRKMIKEGVSWRLTANALARRIIELTSSALEPEELALTYYREFKVGGPE